MEQLRAGNCQHDDLLTQEFLDLVLMYDRLLKGIGTCFGAAYGLDHFGPVLGFSCSLLVFGLDSCFCLLCHGLFDFLVNSYFLQDRVVFLQLETLGRILLVLGGDVATGAGHTGGFMLRALQDHLHP